MTTQAIIMAGGAGTRLRPLTCDLPKPLAPLCGAPVMDYTLRLLQRHGYDRATVTLWYRPQDVMDCFGAARHGVKLSYVTENVPVGTAGSVLLAAQGARDTVLVLSGDGLTDADLTEALAFHRARRAAATLVLKHVDIPLPYGVVVTDQEGRIRRFIEKPDWSRVVSSLVNTGIYLLEPEALALIPPDTPFDFGRELFPLMLEKGLPLYGWETQGYWCDIGDTAAFLAAQADLLAGRAGFEPADPGQRDAPGAVISPDSYVSPDASVAPGADITASCVLAGASVGPGAQLRSAILCPRAKAAEGAVISGGVLGAGSVLGAFSHLAAAVWPGIALPGDTRITETIRQGAPAARIQDSRALADTPAQAGWLAGAFAQGRPTLAVMHDGSSLAACHTVLGALCAYGARQVWALGRGATGMLSHAIQSLHTDGGLLCAASGILLLDRQGLPLSPGECAALETAARRQNLPVPDTAAGGIRSHASLRGNYLTDLVQTLSPGPGAALSLSCKDRFLRALARQALTQAGHRVRADAPLALEVSDSRARLLTAEYTLSPVQQWLLCARAWARQGRPVYDLLDLGTEEGAFLPPDGSEACLAQRRLMQDGVAQALLLMSLFAAESPADALAALPPVARRTAEIPCPPADKGRVLEALLAKASPRPQGGLAAKRGGAHTVIHPDPTLPLMRIAVSARSAETAQELCDFYASKVRKALRKPL